MKSYKDALLGGSDNQKDFGRKLMEQNVVEESKIDSK